MLTVAAPELRLHIEWLDRPVSPADVPDATPYVFEAFDEQPPGLPPAFYDICGDPLAAHLPAQRAIRTLSGDLFPPADGI